MRVMLMTCHLSAVVVMGSSHMSSSVAKFDILSACLRGCGCDQMKWMKIGPIHA